MGAQAKQATLVVGETRRKIAACADRVKRFALKDIGWEMRKVHTIMRGYVKTPQIQKGQKKGRLAWLNTGCPVKFESDNRYFVSRSVPQILHDSS